MAKTRFGGVNGGVTFPSGINMDPTSWDLEMSQAVDDTSNYNDSPAAAGTAAGSGVYTGNFSVNGFFASNAASTAPGIPSAFTANGGSYTLTSNTGCSHGFAGVVERYRISNRKVAGAQGGTVSGRTSGAVSETWAIS